MKEIYYQSDFVILETVKDIEGTPISWNSLKFRLKFYTDGANFVECSGNNGAVKNCTIDEGDSTILHIPFKCHNLNAGVLKKELSIIVENAKFPNGVEVVKSTFATEIKLVPFGQNYFDDYVAESTLTNIVQTGGSIWWSDIMGKPLFKAIATSGAWADIEGKPNFANVATSGNYNDLLNKPNVPARVSELENDSEFVTDADLNPIFESIANAIEDIHDIIPSSASEQNQLADKDFVNSSINNVTAFYITKNASGDPFATKAELNSATRFYSGGEIRVPTRNDYCLVIADETQGGGSCRYIFHNLWEFQYKVNDTPFTQAQVNAINSGITSSLVEKITDNETAIAGKQDKIDSEHKLPVSNVSGLSAVATSGSYNDLMDKPIITREIVSLSQTTATLTPMNYYVMSEVASLNLTLTRTDNRIAEEFCFEFTADADFALTDLNVTENGSPVTWVGEVKSGKLHQCSVLRGVGLIVAVE